MDDDDFDTAIVAVGEDLRLHTEGACYLVPVRELLHIARIEEVMALAEQHGAVLFRSCGDLAILVHLDGPRWRLGDERFCHDGIPFLAITPDPSDERWAELRSPEHLIGHRDETGARIWEAAHWSLRADPPRARAWTRVSEGLAWSGAWMAVTCAAPREAIRAVVEPCPWPPLDPLRYQSPRGASQFDAHHYLVIGDGTLDLSRSGRNVVAWDCYELDLLARIADGALGELGWDLWDSEYGGLVATGHDTASLAGYLRSDGEAAQARERADRELAPHLHPTNATTLDEAVDDFARSIGAGSHEELRAMTSRFEAIPRKLALEVRFHWTSADHERLQALLGHRRRRVGLTTRR